VLTNFTSVSEFGVPRELKRHKFLPVSALLIVTASLGALKNYMLRRCLTTQFVSKRTNLISQAGAFGDDIQEKDLRKNPLHSTVL